EFTAAYSAIGIRPPTYEPRATASVPQMLELIETLIERGHAYAAEGSVYFDVRSWRDYGALTNQRPGSLRQAQGPEEENLEAGKRDPLDFALWKAAKADEPADATWESPWGAG